MGKINFFNEGITYPIENPRKTRSWLNKGAGLEGYTILEINYIFCDDNYLLSINSQYLKHKTLTDIVTFDNSETPGLLEADIFISVERVHENAKVFGISAEVELRRVMVHGLLHLIGYKDKSPRQKTIMRKKEDEYLSLW